jgi:hypothetical protein
MFGKNRIMASKIHHELYDFFPDWKIFGITFFSVLFSNQAIRDIIIDRAVFATIAPLIGSLIGGCFLGAFLAKKTSNKYVVILFGFALFIGKLLISLPDNTEGYQLYNIGIYCIFLSFPAIIISLFGIINMIESGGRKNTSDSEDSSLKVLINPTVMGISGLLLGFVYNWFLRVIDYAENLVLNILMSVVFLSILITITIQSKDFYQFENKTLKEFMTRESEERKELLKVPRAGKKAAIILVSIPCYIYLALSFSYPELYSYLSGLDYQYVIVLISGGIISGIILSAIMLFSQAKTMFIISIQKYYKYTLPLLAIISTFLFGLNSFLPSGNKTMGLVYFVTGLVTASMLFISFKELFDRKLIDMEKILMYFLFITFIIHFGVKAIAVERYMPYLEFLIGICFTIPSLWLFKNKRGTEFKEERNHE